MASSASKPSQPVHEWFEELCALAAIGELSAEEFHDLQAHVANCDNCRSLSLEFARLSLHDVSLLAEEKPEKLMLSDQIASPDADRFLARLIDQIRERKRGVSTIVTSPRPVPSVNPWTSFRDRIIRPIPAIAAVTVLAILGAAVGYRLAWDKMGGTIAGLESQLGNWQHQAGAIVAREQAEAQEAQQGQLAKEQLQKALQESELRYAELQAKHDVLERALSAAGTNVERLSQELRTVRAGQDREATLRQQSEEKQQWMLAEVERLRQAHLQATLRIQEQERIVADLRNELQKNVEGSDLGPDDVAPAQLFGARDLHIVDVYDVNSNGKSRRTYGRVYYAEKKFLVFYAFDLEDKGRDHKAVGFQAWGYREPNAEKPENLGLFYVDDASAHRWVLKVSNPAVLQRIDTVFVTLEPPGGSPVPRGRKLLYASLAGTPNHP